MCLRPRARKCQFWNLWHAFHKQDWELAPGSNLLEWSSHNSDLGDGLYVPANSHDKEDPIATSPIMIWIYTWILPKLFFWLHSSSEAVHAFLMQKLQIAGKMQALYLELLISHLRIHQNGLISCLACAGLYDASDSERFYVSMSHFSCRTQACLNKNTVPTFSYLLIGVSKTSDPRDGFLGPYWVPTDGINPATNQVSSC